MSDQDEIFECCCCGEEFETPKDALAYNCPHCGTYNLLLRGDTEVAET